MGNKVIFFLLVLILYCCSPGKYIIIRQKELKNIDLNNSLVHYIPIDDCLLDKYKVVDSSCTLLEQNKNTRLLRYINSVHPMDSLMPDLNLSRTLVYINESNYKEAAVYLYKIDNPDFNKIKTLLAIDIDYELSKMNNYYNFKYFMGHYQNLVDSFPDDRNLYKIASMRLRFLRYNY